MLRILIANITVLEYMPGGQVEWTKNDKPTMTVDEARSVFRNVVLGLEYRKYSSALGPDAKKLILAFPSPLSRHNTS